MPTAGRIGAFLRRLCSTGGRARVSSQDQRVGSGRDVRLGLLARQFAAVVSNVGRQRQSGACSDASGIIGVVESCN